MFCRVSVFINVSVPLLFKGPRFELIAGRDAQG